MYHYFGEYIVVKINIKNEVNMMKGKLRKGHVRMGKSISVEAYI